MHALGGLQPTRVRGPASDPWSRSLGLSRLREGGTHEPRPLHPCTVTQQPVCCSLQGHRNSRPTVQQVSNQGAGKGGSVRPIFTLLVLVNAERRRPLFHTLEDEPRSLHPCPATRWVKLASGTAERWPFGEESERGRTTFR